VNIRFVLSFIFFFVFSTLYAGDQGGMLLANANVHTSKASVHSMKTAPKRNLKAIRKSTLIMIDAGHGGADYGTYSTTKQRTHEKFLTLSTVMMLTEHLKKMGFRTLLTRSTDKFVDLNERVQLAHKQGAKLFVSVHYNSAPKETAHGMEVFYYQSKDAKRTSLSKRLAEDVLNATIKETKAKSRGVKHGNFLVIRETKIPAILIEGGFLTNTAELHNLRDPVYLNRIARGIARGIDEYVSK
jgi:N-acetylmuramoyl-L-alanine amidase